MIPVHNRGFLFGEGVFRTIKVTDGAIFHLQMHLDKLAKDCQFLSLPMPAITGEQIKQFLIEKQALRGTWRLKLICTEIFYMTLEPYLPNASVKKLTVFPQAIEKPSAKVKSLSYLDSLLAFKYAKERSSCDALILNSKGVILECSRANFLWIHQNTLYFSDPSLPYYEGVTQDLCKDIASMSGLKVCHCQCLLDDLPSDAYPYTSNSMEGLMPVECIDKRVFPRNLNFELYVEKNSNKS